MLLGMCGVLALAWVAAMALGIVGPDARGAAAVLLAGGLAGALGAVLIVRGTMRRVGTPLQDVMEAAERVADGDYSVRVTEQGPPAIHGLAAAFNTMTERLQRHDRLRRDLMADVAHELRTPLAVIQGKLEGLLDGVYPRDDSHLTELLEEAHVLSRLIEDLRTLALSDSGALKLEKELTDIGALAADAVRTFAAPAHARGVSVDVDSAADLPAIPVDPVRIREVLTNLLSNAVRHTPPGGSVKVRLGSAADGGIQVEVQDTGTGMAPEDVERAFERFHKGPDSRGAGLGLSIARSLILAHGGEIRAASAPGRGTTMTITLP